MDHLSLVSAYLDGHGKWTDLRSTVAGNIQRLTGFTRALVLPSASDAIDVAITTARRARWGSGRAWIAAMRGRTHGVLGLGLAASDVTDHPEMKHLSPGIPGYALAEVKDLDNPKSGPRLNLIPWQSFESSPRARWDTVSAIILDSMHCELAAKARALGLLVILDWSHGSRLPCEFLAGRGGVEPLVDLIALGLGVRHGLPGAVLLAGSAVVDSLYAIPAADDFTNFAAGMIAEHDGVS